MYKIYDDWPNLAKKAYDSALDYVHFEKIDHIVFAGMGGSGAIGDLFVSLLSKTNLHVTLVKGYLLPKTIDKNTLVVITSVSGNTIETLSVLESAQKLDCKIIVFCGGGKMKRFCIDNKVNFRIINAIHSPRASFVVYVYAILKTLQNILSIDKNHISSSIDSLSDMQKQISSNNLSDTNPALDLATWISGIPLIYYPWGLNAVAIRFKNSLQENSKLHSMIEDIIETCHNGIVSWDNPSLVQPILIQGKNDHEKTIQRWKIVKDLFKEKGIDYKEIFSIDGNLLSKLMSLIYLLDYASIYHSALFKIDPSPVDSINFIKKRL
jgi:glucose/mannose-6-phosphate isomerase